MQGPNPGALNASVDFFDDLEHKTIGPLGGRNLEVRTDPAQSLEELQSPRWRAFWSVCDFVFEAYKLFDRSQWIFKLAALGSAR